MNRERRKDPRIALAVDVDLTSGHNFFTARTRDLSNGGLFIETNVGLPVGAEVSVHLALLDQTFEARTEVTWVLFGDGGETVGVGLKFLEPTPTLRERIATFMAVRGPMPFDMDDPSEPPPKKGPPPLPKT